MVMVPKNEPEMQFPPGVERYLVFADRADAKERKRPKRERIKKDPDIFIGKPQIYAELINRVDTLQRFYIGVLFKANNVRIRRIIEEIDGGVPLEESSDIDPKVQITRDEESQLMCDYTAGKVSQDPEVIAKAKAAADRIVETHMDLIVSIASHYAKSDHELEEIINEGVLVLLNRLDHYVEHGLMQIRFSTMILNPLFDQLRRRAKELRNTVHIPEETYTKAERHDKALWRKAGEGGGPLSDEEQAGNIGATQTMLQKYQELLAAGDTPERIDENIPQPHLPADEALNTRRTVQVAEERMQGLKPRHETAVRSFYGLNRAEDCFYDDQDQTLEEIGAERSVCRENIRQLKERALSHIRRSLSLRDIEDPRLTQ